MRKLSKQMANSDSNTPLRPEGLTPTGRGAAVNPFGPNSEFAEFCGVPLADRTLNVRIQYAAMRDLRAALAVGCGEVLGLLLGSHSSQSLCIESCEPILLAGKNPDSASLRAAVGRFTGGKLRPIGFFRTQLAGRPEITRADCEVVRRHLPNISENGCVFVVIETPRTHPWSATLFALDSDGMPGSGDPVLEFPFNENLLRKMFSSDFVPEFESPRPREIPEPTGPRPNVPKRLGGTQIDVFNVRFWTIAALCIGGLLSIGIAYTKHFHASGQTRVEAGSVAVYEPLGLKVARSGADFEVSWDRSSKVVRLASEGTLTIRDGEITKIVDLDPTQLREGRILYSPLFRELTVRLEVLENQRRTAGESVQVLGWNTNRSSDLLSADLAVLPQSGAQRPQPPAQLPRVAPIAAGVGAATSIDLGANHTEPRATQAPSVPRKESESHQPSPVADAPEAKALKPEIPPTAPAQPTVRASTPAVVAPTQTPARTAELSVLRPEPPAIPVPSPITAVPVPAVAAPPPATTQPIASQPINVASTLQAAKVIKLVRPVYPIAARISRLQGNVRFKAIIGEDGRIRNLQFVTGPSILVPAASEAVKQWIYQPTLLNGQPTEVSTDIDVKFVLNP